jgi:dTDP-glucose pyrophosphorylase
MSHWRKTFVSAQNGTIAEAIKIIDALPEKICLIVDEKDKLLGTVTDGDIRRGLLRSIPLDALATEIMRKTFITASPDDSQERLLEIINTKHVRQLPIVNSRSRVVGLVTEDDLQTKSAAVDNWVVLMAGGLGNRLRPMTDDVPKPLLKVGEKPVLETILDTFIKHDFENFYISVNYRADMIKDYFGDGKRWNVTIRYLEELDKLGTAGALSLLPEAPTEPVIVMNADLLTKVNFRSLLDFHNEQNAMGTMCVREYDFQVPFGVVNIENNRVASIEEKPVHTFFINAGIYVLSPQILSHIRQNTRLDMTELFESAISTGESTAVFPIREYWIDIGQLGDFQRANWDFPKIFK